MLRFLLAALGTAGALAAARRLFSSEPDLFGAVAIITGGSRGLGFLIARELAREGCRLAICARDPDELERARLDLERRGAEVIAIRCDVADPVAASNLVSETERRLGPVDILVNNASIIQVAPIEALGVKDFQRALAVTFRRILVATDFAESAEQALACAVQLARRHGAELMLLPVSYTHLTLPTKA